MFLTLSPFSANYSVRIQAESPFPAQEPDYLKYDIEVNFLRKEDSFYLVELKKSEVILNDEEVHDAYNDMVIITAKATERIILKLNEEGKALGFINMSEVLSRWKEAREEVESQYTGEPVKEFLDDMETHLTSPEKTWRALSKSILYSLFFHGLYKNYPLETSKDVLELRDLLPEDTIDIPVTKTLFRNEEGPITIKMDSGEKEIQIEDEQESNSPSSLEENKTYKGTIRCQGFYSLEATGKITEAEMTAEVHIPDYHSKRIHIKVSEIS